MPTEMAIIILSTLLLASTLKAKAYVMDGNRMSNEIPSSHFKGVDYNHQGSTKQNAPTILTPVATGFQNLLSSPILQAMLSNITVQTVLSDPLVQGVLSNPVVQSVLTNPIVQAVLSNPELQGLAMQTFLSNYTSAMSPPATTTTGLPPLLVPIPSTAAPQSTTVMNAIITGLDEIINLLQNRMARRNRRRQKNKN